MKDLIEQFFKKHDLPVSDDLKRRLVEEVEKEIIEERKLKLKDKMTPREVIDLLKELAEVTGLEIGFRDVNIDYEKGYLSICGIEKGRGLLIKMQDHLEIPKA